MKHISIIKITSILAIILAVASPVFADDDVKVRAGAEIREKVRAFREDKKEIRGETAEDVKAKIQAMRVDVKTMVEAGATEEEIKAKIEEVRLSNQKDRAEFRQEIEEKRRVLKDDIKREIDSFKDGQKVRLSATAKVEVKQRLNVIFSKLNNAINRFENFDTKLDEEIQKRKTSGVDMTEVEVSLELARRSLEETKVSITAVSTAVNASVDDETSASKEAIKAVINDALQSIKETKDKYKEVIKLLPGIRAEVETGVEVK